MSNETWACGSCGRTENVGGFCGRCGAAAPAQPMSTGYMPAAAGATYLSSAPPSLPTMPPATSLPATHAYGSAPHSVSNAPGITLMPGETTQLDVSFSRHLILQHLRTRVLLTDRRVVVQSPHALFGLIPMGYASGSAPLDAIDQINHGHMMRGNHVLFGIGAAIGGLVMLVSGSLTGGASGVLFALVLWAVAAGLLASARTTGIFFDTGGNHLMAAAGRGKDIATIQDTAQRVIEAIQERHDRE